MSGDVVVLFVVAVVPVWSFEFVVVGVVPAVHEELEPEKAVWPHELVVSVVLVVLVFVVVVVFVVVEVGGVGVVTDGVLDVVV